MLITTAKNIDSKLVMAINRLMPQLTPTQANVSEDSLNELIANGASELIIAQEGEEIVGTLSLIVFTIPTGKKAFIEDVVVDEKHRGKGLAEKMVSEAINLAKQKSVKRIELSSRPSRIAANKLYQKLGFKIRETNFYRLEL